VWTSPGLAIGLVLAIVGATVGCGGGTSATGGTGGTSATGGAGGIPVGQGGATGSRGGAGGSLAGTTGGGGSGGSGSGGSAGSGSMPDGGGSDAAPCSPDNYLFDCPEHSACDATTLRCTTKCSDSQPCRGGCCSGGTCQPGTEATACGHDGMLCSSCSALDDGPLCLPWPYTDSPTRPGGYCACMTSTDCTASFNNVCQPELTLTKRCCHPTGAACSPGNARACCSGVCAGTCG
jgi:hypothetical protein